MISRTRDLLITVGVLGLALALRTWALGEASLWMDEGASLLLSQGSATDIVRRVVAEESHPPLYYLALGLWRQLGDSELFLRALSAICGTAVVWVTVLLGRALDDTRSGRLAALFTALSGLCVLVSREARMYAPATLLVALETLYLLRTLRDGRGRDAACYAACAAACAWTHYITVFVLAAQFVTVLFVGLRGGFDRTTLRTYGLATGAAFLLWVPWLVLKGNPTARGDLLPFMLFVRSGESLPWQLLSLCYDEAYGLTLFFRPLDLGPFGRVLYGQFALAAGVAATCVLGGAWQVRRERERGWLVVAASFLLTALIVLIASRALEADIFKSRYLSVTAPCFWLLVARFLTRLEARFVATALTAFVMTLTTVSSLNLLFEEPWSTQDIRGAAQCVARRARAGDVLVLDPGYNRGLVDRYAPALTSTCTVVPIGRRGVEGFDARAYAGRRVWLMRADPSLVDAADQVRRRLCALATPTRVFWSPRLNVTFTVEVERFDVPLGAREEERR